MICDDSREVNSRSAAERGRPLGPVAQRHRRRSARERRAPTREDAATAGRRPEVLHRAAPARAARVPCHRAIASDLDGGNATEQGQRDLETIADLQHARRPCRRGAATRRRRAQRSCTGTGNDGWDGRTVPPDGRAPAIGRHQRPKLRTGLTQRSSMSEETLTAPRRVVASRAPPSGECGGH